MNFYPKPLHQSDILPTSPLLDSVQEESKFPNDFLTSRNPLQSTASSENPFVLCSDLEPSEILIGDELDEGLIYPLRQSTQTSARLQESQNSDNNSLYDLDIGQRLAERSRSAPARFLSYVEGLRDSRKFFVLEAAAIAAENLIFRPDEKVDLDCSIGTVNCKSFLVKVESLVAALNVSFVDRSYRDEFSLPYRTLYSEDSLCYLTEVLDSAQEGLPFIVLNSEKYIFSSTVITKGNELFFTFVFLKELIKDSYNLYACLVR